MKHKTPAYALIAFFAALTSSQSSAQLATQSLQQGLTPSDLITTLVGQGVSVSNIQFHGSLAAAGKFTGGTTSIGFTNGIILSSGCISNVIAQNGLNNYNDVTCDNQNPGDPDLDALIPGYQTFDRCVLEFDFVCQNLQVISFEYVFASDEYNEYANTAFNDVFGFFVNGVNVALLPDNVTPVSINNVNCGNPVGDPTPHNCVYFINNSCEPPPGALVDFPCVPPYLTEMDGRTVVLNVFTTVQPGVNHIKLAIGDAGDPILDSNVFIRTQSFTCTPPGTNGACCLPSGLCTDETQADCAEDGGVFYANANCQTVNCNVPPCTADINNDHVVNVADLLMVITGWGPCPTAGAGAAPSPSVAKSANPAQTVAANLGMPRGTGACCFSDGTCDNQSAADCADNGGVYHEGEDCDFYQCIPVPPCPADITLDGVVNVADLLAVIVQWGPCPN